MLNTKIEEEKTVDFPVKLFDENSFKTHPNLNEMQSTELLHATDVSDFLRTMYESGADANYIFRGRSCGLTPLAMACQQDNAEAVRFLLSQGADPNLNLAVFFIRSVEVAKIFVEYEANLNVKGWYGNTLLHHVCVRNNVALAEYYIEQGLSASEQNDFGQTPTHHAFTRLISVPNTDALQPLTNLPTKQESHPLLAKMSVGHQKAHAFLRATSNDTQRPKFPKMNSGTPRELCYPLILLFLRNDGNSAVLDKLGYSPWDYAIASGWESTLNKLYQGIKYEDCELIQTLRSGDSKPLLEHLAEGRSPDVIERCETLVHIAANNGDCPALSALIESKAQVDRKLTPPEYNKDCLFGKTPLFSVCGIMNSPQRLQAMQLLIRAGAKVNTPCEGFQTPFLVLCQHDRAEAIRVMIQDAYEQLISGTIFADNPTILKKFNHRMEFAFPATKEMVGNEALKTLCKMFIADELSVEKYWGEHNVASFRYQQAKHARNAALTAFESELESFKAGKSSNEFLDAALNQYLESSTRARAARHEELQACDRACQQMTFHQSGEYKIAHHRLGEIILRIAAQVELHPEIRALINSNAALQERFAINEVPDSAPK